MEKIVSYFENGFYLANKNLNLYFIALLFGWLIDFLNYLIKPQSISLMTFIINILTLIIGFLFSAFDLSRPQFLEAQQNSHTSSLNFISKTVLKNAMRLILPVLLLIICLVFVLVLLLIAVFMIVHPSPSQSEVWAKNIVNLVRFLEIIFIVILAFFGYTSLFFSLETIGFFRSLKESLIYAWKHIPLTLVVVVVNGVVFVISQLTYFGINIQSPLYWLHTVLVLVITYYIRLVTISAIYLYYKSNPAQLRVHLKSH